jgi:hypothetical protein
MVHKKPSWVVKWTPALGSLLAAMWLLSCTDQVASPTSIDETILPSATYTSSPVPGPTPTPTGEQPTATPVSNPTPGDCDGGYLYFATASDRLETQPQDAIYLMCSDGSFSQKVVSKEKTIPEQQFLVSLDASLDGRRLAFSTVDRQYTNGHVYLVDLSDHNVQEIYAADYGITDLSWSADGEYLGYTTYEHGGGSRGAIEVLHIGTLTRSRMVTERSLSNEEYAFTLSRFRWSPDGGLVLYTGDLAGVYQALLIPQGFIAEISCDPNTHECSFGDPTELGWFDNQ